MPHSPKKKKTRHETKLNLNMACYPGKVAVFRTRQKPKELTEIKPLSIELHCFQENVGGKILPAYPRPQNYCAFFRLPAFFRAFQRMLLIFRGVASRDGW